MKPCASFHCCCGVRLVGPPDQILSRSAPQQPGSRTAKLSPALSLFVPQNVFVFEQVTDPLNVSCLSNKNAWHVVTLILSGNHLLGTDAGRSLLPQVRWLSLIIPETPLGLRSADPCSVSHLPSPDPRSTVRSEAQSNSAINQQHLFIGRRKRQIHCEASSVRFIRPHKSWGQTLLMLTGRKINGHSIIGFIFC